MKGVIYLFSATGNTELVAKEYVAVLKQHDIDTNIVKIEQDLTVAQPDFIAIAYPIHAFSAPENVIKFVEGLPEGNCPVFFIKTGGECLRFNNASSAILKRILKRKGYSVLCDNLYVMPYNMLYRHSESMATKMYFTMKRKVRMDVENILSFCPQKVGKDTPVSVVFRGVEQPFMHLNGKLFKVNDKCIGCNKCVNSCPQKNIQVKDGKITFGSQCIGCVRCSFNCPTKAIDIGILNMWRVNGKYTFDCVEPETYEVKYLKKSYKKYFDKYKE